MATWQGFVYVVSVIDAFARRIVGWRVSRTALGSFVLDALVQALHERRPVHRDGLVCHSDRGVQYVSTKFSERLVEAGIEPSVGSVTSGHCHGGAFCRHDFLCVLNRPPANWLWLLMS